MLPSQLLLDQRSTFRRCVIDFDMQHGIVRKQFRGFLRSGLAFELSLKMPVHDERVATCRCNVSALNISWLLLLDLESRFLDRLDFCH
jgi:hypothetical protein